MSLELRDRLGGLSSNAAPVNSSPFQISNNLTGYQAISNIGNGNTFYYLAVHRTQNQWEVGRGQIQISGLFTYVLRDAANVFDGTAGPGALTQFSLGDIDIVSAYPAALISALNDLVDGGQGFLVNASTGVIVQRSLTAGQAVSIENASGVSGNPIIYVDSTGFPPGVYGSGTQIPSFTLDAAGRIVAVSLAPVGVSGDVVTSIVTSVSSYLGSENTSGVVSLYLDVTSLEGRFDSRYASLTALTSVTDVLGTSIANTNANIAMVSSAVTSINAVTTSINAQLTSIGSAYARLNGGNTFTSTNTFQAPVSVSTLTAGGASTFNGVFVVNGDAALNAVTSVSILRASGAATFNAVTSVSILRASGAATFNAVTSVSVLRASGDAQFNAVTSVSVLRASGAATLSSTLGVSGATTMAALTASGTATLNGAVQANGVTSVSVLRSSGAVTFNAVTSVSTLSGSGPVQIRNGTWTPPAVLTDAASIVVDMSRSNDFVVTLGGNRTVELPSNCQPGQSGTIFIHQDGTGGRTLAWNGAWRFPSSIAPTLTATSSARDSVMYEVYTSTIIVAGALLNT